jgi:[glutamine synthetase] adenylyltransferase / [glutamine synthetase]-adenylyl-L-tyrosine phosphorylase
MSAEIKLKSLGSAANWFGRPPCQLTSLNKTRADQYIKEFGRRAKDEDLPRLAQLASTKNEISAFLGATFDLSPYLREYFTIQPNVLDALFDVSAPQKIDQIIDRLPSLGQMSISEADLMVALRKNKSEAHALIALCDLAGILGGVSTTQKVSQLAIACTKASVRFLLLQAAKSGKLNLANLGEPERDSGWIILGMGKLGANELNYSSDIDLIVLFDPDVNILPDRYEGIETFSRMTRQLVRIMQDRTGDGYVFRTDLRLRPDPGSTPLAMPVEAALNYYEGRGQNWERAALIKARPIAGDIEAGERFLKELSPFIWRKYLDYAAIADVHSIKRQIHAHKGHGEIAVHGHNVKLGRGGIREVEFFVQTQQLIAGGREPTLRGRETVTMLAELAKKGWITANASAHLALEYWFLRDIEHRIQMVADEQTHTLPDDDEGLLRVAYLAGFKSVDAFAIRLRHALETIEQHYAELFETAPELSEGIGNLVFTGDNDDPGTIETLTRLGYKRPSDMCRIVRTWHFGRYKATQSAEARERLTELTPSLLKAFGGSSFPDDTTVQFDTFLQGLPSGIQLFSLLQTNVALLDLLVRIMGAAPKLSEIITRKPHVFDGLLDPAIYRDVPTIHYLTARLDAFMAGISGYEESLDRFRIFNSEQKFLIGVRILTGALHPRDAGVVFSGLADLVLARTFALVQLEFQRKHGIIEGAQVALLGFGKLGSQELTAGSDIDLVVLYEHPEDTQESNGDKPLYASQYFSRLTQRLITAVSAPTAEGILYELDLRLRPSGNKGPVASRLSAFEIYQHHEAWTWEHMALTRARVVYGADSFKASIDTVINSVLTRPKDIKKVDSEVAEMRALIGKEKPANGPWDMKLIPGGLVDLEFIAQAAAMSGRCEVQDITGTMAILQSLNFQKLDLKDRDQLVVAHQLFSSMTQILRLCLQDGPDDKLMSKSLLEIMCSAAELPDVATLEAHIQDTAKQVRIIFNRLFR